MAAYAEQADFEDYVEGWTTTDPSALDRLLERASEDIDTYLGFHDRLSSGTYEGRKLDPTTLDYAEARALLRATCAQAEYRNAMGEEFMVRPQHPSISGPDFTVSGGEPMIAPKARRELAGSGLVRRVTSLGSPGRRPSWLSFAYNVEDP